MKTIGLYVLGFLVSSALLYAVRKLMAIRMVTDVKNNGSNWSVSVRTQGRTQTWVSFDKGNTWRSESWPYLVEDGWRKRYLNGAANVWFMKERGLTPVQPAQKHVCTYCHTKTTSYCDALVEKDGVVYACEAYVCDQHKHSLGDNYITCPKHWHIEDKRHIHVDKPS